ncbi:hypothetical protein K435DRAFT_791157 [Dendrothele bispora CBS 962.96]|uniref:Uncharacterized protein n=1 Tax=Dendrothele bispora (strain CBS 962.96) TaxID=1314807 RepID=A0A4V4HHV8_DENBC|nr:hypothetical protein K435DRAFT_791157 [Dendrothele bispora CBS 962.96]
MKIDLKCLYLPAPATKTSKMKKLSAGSPKQRKEFVKKFRSVHRVWEYKLLHLELGHFHKRAKDLSTSTWAQGPIDFQEGNYLEDKKTVLMLKVPEDKDSVVQPLQNTLVLDGKVMITQLIDQPYLIQNSGPL